MKRITGILSVVLFGLLSACTLPYTQRADLQTTEVIYSADGQTLKGYLAYDKNIRGKRPGILVVHEWWGHNDYARKRAEMLAQLGYTALAVDMYGDGKQATHPDEAGKFAEEVSKNKSVGEKRFLAALDFLRRQETVDAGQIAAIGYCFGGGVVLHMARIGTDIAGVVSFHGSLGTDTPAKPGAVKAKVLVLHGAADPFVPAEQVEAFKQEMDVAGADYTFIAYPNVKHSFTNPDADVFGEKFNLPLKYDKEADQKSWSEMQTFFRTIFRD